MRKSRLARAGTTDTDLQMAPLIDCVFLLLTYFLFTISLSTVEGLLPAELALGDDFQEKKLDLDEPHNEVVVRIVQTGTRAQYFIDDWPAADFAAVARHLGGLPPSTIVVIDSGPTVAYEHVVKTYNRCLELGIEQVVFPLAGSGASTTAAPRL